MVAILPATVLISYLVTLMRSITMIKTAYRLDPVKVLIRLIALTEFGYLLLLISVPRLPMLVQQARRRRTIWGYPLQVQRAKEQ